MAVVWLNWYDDTTFCYGHRVVLLLGLVREASTESGQWKLTAETHNWPNTENNLQLNAQA